MRQVIDDDDGNDGVQPVRTGVVLVAALLELVAPSRRSCRCIVCRGVLPRSSLTRTWGVGWAPLLALVQKLPMPSYSLMVFEMNVSQEGAGRYTRVSDRGNHMR